MHELLKRAQVRLFRTKYLNIFTWLVIGLSALASAAVVVGWREALGFSWPLLLGVLALLVVAALVAWRLTPGALQTARKLEQHFGLQERLSTSLELGGRDDPLALSLRDDAELRARDLSLKTFAKPSVSSPQAWLLLGCAVALVVVVLVVPLPSSPVRINAAGTGGDEVSSTVAEQREFVRSALEQVQQAAPAESSAPVSRNNARPTTPQQQSGATNRPPALPVSGAASQITSTSAPSTVQRDADEVGEALRPTAAAGETPGQAPSESVSAATARNDGSANPNYDQATGRDQELREYARHRDAASSPGGGSGDPVAMVDAAVAGDATAGFEGGEGSAVPDGPAAADELNIPDITDPSGRRVRVERLPDELEMPGSDTHPGRVEFAERDEPLVSREVDAGADLDLLRRYHSPASDPAESP